MARGISFKEKKVATFLQTTNLVSTSFTFGSGNLVLIYGPPSTATLSGSSISGAAFAGDTPTGVNVWQATGTGAAGAITEGKGSGSFVDSMSIYEITGGGGETVSNVQFAQGAAGTTATATLTGWQTGNSTLAFTSVIASTAAITPRASWTEVYDATEVLNGVNFRNEEQHFLTGEATATATWTGAADWSMRLIEIGSAATDARFGVGTLPVGF